jgi:hypothetical protein
VSGSIGVVVPLDAGLELSPLDKGLNDMIRCISAVGVLDSTAVLLFVKEIILQLRGGKKVPRRLGRSPTPGFDGGAIPGTPRERFVGKSPDRRDHGRSDGRRYILRSVAHGSEVCLGYHLRRLHELHSACARPGHFKYCSSVPKTSARKAIVLTRERRGVAMP